MMEKCSHDMKISTVTWKAPPIHIYKLNTDGSALNNLGRIAGGGILRNYRGK